MAGRENRSDAAPLGEPLPARRSTRALARPGRWRQIGLRVLGMSGLVLAMYAAAVAFGLPLAKVGFALAVFGTLGDLIARRL